MSRLVCIALLASVALTFVAACNEPGPKVTYTKPPEGSLRVGSIHELDGFESQSPLHFEAHGHEIVIDTLILVISAVELHACLPGEHPDGEREPPADRINFRLFDLLGGTAHAHTPGSSTRFGTPVARNLASKGGRARIIGEIAPPLGIYCHITAISAPADDDLDNPTQVPTENLQGHSLLVRGKWRPTVSSESEPPDSSNGDNEWRTFEFSSERAQVISIPAVDPKTGEPPIRFATPSDVTMALTEIQLTRRILEPLAAGFPAPDSDTGAALHQRLTKSMRIHEFQ